MPHTYSQKCIHLYIHAAKNRFFSEWIFAATQTWFTYKYWWKGPAEAAGSTRVSRLQCRVGSRVCLVCMMYACIQACTCVCTHKHTDTQTHTQTHSVPLSPFHLSCRLLYGITHPERSTCDFPKIGQARSLLPSASINAAPSARNSLSSQAPQYFFLLTPLNLPKSRTFSPKRMRIWKGGLCQKNVLQRGNDHESSCECGQRFKMSLWS